MNGKLKLEIGKWKSETRSGMASIGHGRKKKNAKSRFFTSRGAYVNLRYIALE